MLGEPLQLATQMLTFTSAEQPILVDAVTSQSNKARYHFNALPITTRIPGQLKQHAMLAIGARKR